MRNCFVPFCDAYCKAMKMEKRMMFIPPRDQTIFNAWKKLLYNKRVFRQKDKVCERHFEKDQILTHWDHIIEGAVVQLQRDKPKLKSTAIPSQNLPEMNIPSDVEEEIQIEAANPLKSNTNGLTVENVNVRRQNTADDEIASPPKRKRVNDGEDSTDADDDIVILKLDDDTDNDLEADQQRERQVIFESIYDDIYEVVLPTTLWGIHRDPERKFIVFTEFDENTMSTAKLLHVSDTCEMKAYIHQEEVQLLKRDNLSVDTLTDALSELDELCNIDEDGTLVKNLDK